MDVGALVGELAACDPAEADRGDLVACAAASARVRAWLDGFDVQVGRALEAKTGYGAKALADAMCLSLAGGGRVIERGQTLAALPAIEAAVVAGDVSGGHVDAATRALRHIDAEHRGELTGIIDAMVSEARSLPIGEYEKQLRRVIRRLQGDKDQKKQVRWRSWLERVSGMLRGDYACDPENAVKVDKRIQDEIDRLFADGVPDDAPDDPIERQQYLAGLAVTSLLLGNGGAVGKPELIVVVDATQTEVVVDWGLPVDLPASVLADVAARAKLHVVAVWPPADLNLGRSQRLASAAQRRVLRAMYPTCAIPGCETRFARLRMHHVWWWEHGGPTDLDNLLPICSHHHSCVHDKGWHLKLLPDRTLEITLPDGQTMETGPPARAPS
ncbi:MAG TPA: DUF222 domain-containing protein [Acidimicrobiales bacterium]|nr:DUF222 domain-containing protein [Acidimicrobiales bacterium]